MYGTGSCVLLTLFAADVIQYSRDARYGMLACTLCTRDGPLKYLPLNVVLHA